MTLKLKRHFFLKKKTLSQLKSIYLQLEYRENIHLINLAGLAHCKNVNFGGDCHSLLLKRTTRSFLNKSSTWLVTGANDVITTENMD